MRVKKIKEINLYYNNGQVHIAFVKQNFISNGDSISAKEQKFNFRKIA